MRSVLVFHSAEKFLVLGERWCGSPASEWSSQDRELQSRDSRVYILNLQASTESLKLGGVGGVWKENYKEKRLKFKAISIEEQGKNPGVQDMAANIICKWGQEPTPYENRLPFSLLNMTPLWVRLLHNFLNQDLLRVTGHSQ